MIRFVMVNVFVQQFRFFVVFIDFDDFWFLYWMDVLIIYWFIFELRVSVVGYIEEFLQDFDNDKMGIFEVLVIYVCLCGEDEGLLFVKK